MSRFDLHVQPRSLSRFIPNLSLPPWTMWYYVGKILRQQYWSEWSSLPISCRRDKQKLWATQNLLHLSLREFREVSCNIMKIFNVNVFHQLALPSEYSVMWHQWTRYAVNRFSILNDWCGVSKSTHVTLHIQCCFHTKYHESSRAFVQHVLYTIC